MHSRDYFQLWGSCSVDLQTCLRSWQKAVFSVGIAETIKGPSLCAFLDGSAHPLPKWRTWLMRPCLPLFLRCPPHYHCHVSNLIPLLDPESFAACWWQPHPFDLHFVDYMLDITAFQLSIQKPFKCHTGMHAHAHTHICTNHPKNPILHRILKSCFSLRNPYTLHRAYATMP